ncbi:putative Rossmann fold flavoprotein [Pararhizobium capsulatum DSM 1112]|uniref:Rossmann fold flavoprotein n=1 Tax=Pararhizobium capsulatum DSM 1112 TaxID=1121113 RepID=A0ABU0BML5_9HYPH|nr:NAD(P)/FAD-dependent oxidoreductase [Pararhizobium capsulatum]MDQ0319202.1 putative Rossmann fold flavoprotein [Pararhizobium capsulatum DSM 1112]
MAENYDVAIIGAGAAGMMCAIEAGKRGRRVIVLDHAKAPGEKIRISGGGRCNFTNIHTTPKAFLSANPHFCKSALARFTPQDFLAMVERHGIAWHEKTLGQLFCDDSAKDIIRMLLTEIREAGVSLKLSTAIEAVERGVGGYRVLTSEGRIDCASLVIATGGKSIPKMGATGFAYKIAEQFGLSLLETRPGLVPLTLDPSELERLASLSGVAVDARASVGKASFDEALLITHRGLSGPAILQISSYWREGGDISLRLLPALDIAKAVKDARRGQGKQALQTVLSEHLPKRLAQFFVELAGLHTKSLADLSDKVIDGFCARLSDWRIKPAGSEGYRTAEVTLGGIDTGELDSRTMQARNIDGLFFIGECVDVTGWLGGYNFQWAWASGFAAGQAA